MPIILTIIFIESKNPGLPSPLMVCNMVTYFLSLISPIDDNILYSHNGTSDTSPIPANSTKKTDDLEYNGAIVFRRYGHDYLYYGSVSQRLKTVLTRVLTKNLKYYKMHHKLGKINLLSILACCQISLMFGSG
jgi:hypothetical protein